MKRLTESQLIPPRTAPAFEIRPEHRARPGWQWLWDRLLQPVTADAEQDGEQDAA